MKFDPKKKCFVNDDGSKMEFFWPKGKTPSMVWWSNKRYADYMRKSLMAANDGKSIVDNSHLWGK